MLPAKWGTNRCRYYRAVMVYTNVCRMLWWCHLLLMCVYICNPVFGLLQYCVYPFWSVCIMSVLWWWLISCVILTNTVTIQCHSLFAFCPSHFHGKINLNDDARYIRNAATHRHTLAYTTNTYTYVHNKHTQTHAHRDSHTHAQTHILLVNIQYLPLFPQNGTERRLCRYVRSILSTTKFTLNIKASIISKAWLTSLMLQAIKDNTQAMPTIGRSNPRHSFFT